MDETFFLSNIAPQVGDGFNRHCKPPLPSLILYCPERSRAQRLGICRKLVPKTHEFLLRRIHLHGPSLSTQARSGRQMARGEWRFQRAPTTTITYARTHALTLTKPDQDARSHRFSAKRLRPHTLRQSRPRHQTLFALEPDRSRSLDRSIRPPQRIHTRRDEADIVCGTR